MARSIIQVLGAIGALVCGCAGIAGFEDLHADCPAEEPLCADAGSGASGPGGGAGSSGAAGGAGGAGGGGRAGCEPPAMRGGPSMAKFVRPDGSCFWIDTTEVTQEQYAEYLDTKPEPSGDLRCAGEPELSDRCKNAQAEAGSPSDLPQTCVDWCAAQAFCLWAGKDLCPDDAQAVGAALLPVSDYHFACSEGGANDFTHAACATTVCNVPAANLREIRPAGKTANCFVSAAGAVKVFDLIGNVSEWTKECLVDDAIGPCLVRGGSFDQAACCDEPSRIERREGSTNLGFRCCYTPP
jgi:formylglycine-generating enzyme